MKLSKLLSLFLLNFMFYSCIITNYGTPPSNGGITDSGDDIIKVYLAWNIPTSKTKVIKRVHKEAKEIMEKQYYNDYLVLDDVAGSSRSKWFDIMFFKEVKDSLTKAKIKEDWPKFGKEAAENNFKLGWSKLSKGMPLGRVEELIGRVYINHRDYAYAEAGTNKWVDIFFIRYGYQVHILDGLLYDFRKE